jgi:hypothetical protein
VAGRTNTEAIRDLERMHATLFERVGSISRDTEAIWAAHDEMVDSVRELDRRLILAEERVAELRKARDERDQRRRQLDLLFLGSLLTLVVNIILLFIGKK